MGADALRASTGRDHEGWRTLLTEAGATGWSHAATARWLVTEHDVPGWWAQGITVDFEQACKGRLPGMQSDGTFATSATRTIPGARLDALTAVREAITSLYGAASSSNLAASMPVVRWKLPDGGRLAAAAGPEKPTGTPITLTREKLASHDDVESTKAHLIELLESAKA
ncbi:hypothetical protein [Ornithinimicrobium sp. Y1694]|uniref:hypothetical protein n=1 Tax=Ornithinimicrobium sp. Y1694 TaxID=3418590 RepID=UPI003CEF3B20